MIIESDSLQFTTYLRIETGMREFHYNLLQTARIKSIFLALVAVISIASMMFEFVRHAEIAQDLSAGVIYFVIIAPVVVLSLVIHVVPFEQVIERIDRLHFQSYYNIGGIKFRVHVFNYGGEVAIEQDKDRYYCLLIKLADGQKLPIERIPTRNAADRRLEELREVFL